MIDEIFEQLKEAVAKGATLPAPVMPEIEEDLKPFIVREMTSDEIALMAARDAAEENAQKMVAKVLFMNRLGMLDEVGPDELKQDEIKKFKATMLADIFFWQIQEALGWQFASVYQRRTQDGQVVLVGLKLADARAFHQKQMEAQQMEELIGEKPGPRLVN